MPFNLQILVEDLPLEVRVFLRISYLASFKNINSAEELRSYVTRIRDTSYSKITDVPTEVEFHTLNYNEAVEVLNFLDKYIL